MKQCANPLCENMVGDRASRCKTCKRYLLRVGHDRTRIVRKKGNYLSGERHPRWKGDAARPETKRARMSCRMPVHECERCGGKASDRHHVDGDTNNNSLMNVRGLCRRCHMIEDGRGEALGVMGAAHSAAHRKPPRMCVTCGVPATRIWHGECHSCDAYRRRNGFSRKLYLEAQATLKAHRP